MTTMDTPDPERIRDERDIERGKNAALRAEAEHLRLQVAALTAQRDVAIDERDMARGASWANHQRSAEYLDRAHRAEEQLDEVREELEQVRADLARAERAREEALDALNTSIDSNAVLRRQLSPDLAPFSRCAQVSHADIRDRCDEIEQQIAGQLDQSTGELREQSPESVAAVDTIRLLADQLDLIAAGEHVDADELARTIRGQLNHQ